MTRLFLTFWLAMTLLTSLSANARTCAQLYSDWSVKWIGSGISGTAYLHQNSVTNQSFVEKIYNMPSQRENDQKAFALLHKLTDLSGSSVKDLQILKPEWLPLEQPAQGRPIAKSRLPYARGETLESALIKAAPEQKIKLLAQYERALSELLGLCQSSGLCRGEIEKDAYNPAPTLKMGGMGALVLIKTDNVIYDRSTEVLTIIDPF
ncbi:MAG: hypothetical protein ACK5P7_01025 [Bdellovibrio sp.]|jgi:hypothetical protein